jgi:hypothetical protein
MKELINQHDAEGRRHGIWESYYSDGTLWCREQYHHGRWHGVREWYWGNGTLGWREHYYHGVKKGLEICGNYRGRIASKRYHLVIR